MELISIDPCERTILRALRRAPDAATMELRQAITATNTNFENLARAFPGVSAIAAFSGGRSAGALVIALSKDFIHYSPVATERAALLGQIVARLPDELVSAFLSGFNSVQHGGGAAQG